VETTDSESKEERPAPVTARWLEPAAVIVIVALAIGLRFLGIEFGFPERVRPDEQYFVNAVRRFDSYNTLDPDWFYYPSLYMYINLAVWRGYALVQLLAGHYQPPQGLDRLRARSPDAEFLLGRCVTACFGVATVVIAYLLARRFYGRKAAATAAFLLAINGLHTLNSHFYKSDVATTFFTVAALGCMARYVQDRRVGWNVGAAVCSGLAASTNYYGGFLLAPLVVSQFMALYRKENVAVEGQTWLSGLPAPGRAIARGMVRWETYAMPAIALAVLAATSPYCFIRWKDFLDAFHRMLFADRQSLYDTLVRVVQFDDYGFQTSPLAYSLLFCWRYSTGLLLGVVSVVGLVFLAVRGKAVGRLLLLFFAVHFAMTASGKAVFMRYYLSLIPVMTIAAGALFSWTIQRRWPGDAAKQNLILAVALIVCGFMSLWVSVRQDRLLARKDTRVEAREWLAANLPPSAVVGTPVDWWGNYYPYGKPTLPVGCTYVPVAPEQVRAKGIRYVVVDESLLRLYSPPDRPQWSAWLSTNAKLLFEVSPYPSPSPTGKPPVVSYDQLDAFYTPVAGFAAVTRPGPRIRLYEVSPAP